MPTVIRCDIRGPAPYWTLVSRDPDRVVQINSPAAGAPDLDLGQTRTDILSALAQIAAEIMANVGPQSVLDNLARVRQEILSNTGPNATLAELERMRESILAGIAGDNVGPVMIPAQAALNLTATDALREMARKQSNPTLAAQLFLLADLEYRYALDVQAAQQVVQDAVMAGADWLFGDTAFLMALSQRDRMMREAVRRFNADLPPWAQGAKKAEVWW